MKSETILRMWSLAVICLLAACGGPAAAYIKAPPQTLGSICLEPDLICVLKVDKVDAERGAIIFKHVEQLKGMHDGTVIKHVIKPEVKGSRIILDWAVEGKTAVMFYFTGGNNRGHVYIDGYWYWVGGVGGNSSEKTARTDRWWSANQGEPNLLSIYCGSADKLPDAITKILRGEEVVVPGMASNDKKALEERRAKVQDVRASLKLVGADTLARIANRSDGKKPGTKPGPVDTKPGATKPVGEKLVGEKPIGEKPSGSQPALVGRIQDLSSDGKRFSLLPLPTEKNKQPTAIEIQISKGTSINPGKLAVGQTVSVWLEKGDPKIATAIQIGKPSEKPTTKPAPANKGTKPAPDTIAQPEAVKKPKPPARPARDSTPTRNFIDGEVDKHLAKVKIPASPQADDAEFLRRVTLDLTGRIPTYQRTVAFLDSKDANKRRKLIDELLDSSEYGEHLATIWRNLLMGRTVATGEKGGGGSDTLRPWLAEQFNDNRGWNAIVADLLTAEGTSRDNPATAFLMANAENGRPQPNRVTGSVASLFWGVHLRCAECHSHPFARWKQDDFWGTAAFFGKIQYGGKGGPPTLTESLVASASTKEKGAPLAAVVRGTAIVIPATSGKGAGQLVKARFLGANEPTLDEKEPFRPRFAEWATAADNPYFAKSTVNRIWAHFFGRGFVNPLDAFDTGSPSHPELLDRLAREFADFGFDLKHLARCITTSKAYQRTSRPVAGNEADVAAFSHMSVKVLTPEALYDALEIIGKGGGNTGKGSGGKVGGDKQENRDQFLRSFRIDEEAAATDYIQGIPQLLRMMNASSANRGAAVVEKLCSSRVSHPDAIDTLYLTALSRRPTADEVKLMEGYLSKRKDDREGYRGVLWILMNSSEFALNH